MGCGVSSGPLEVTPVEKEPVVYPEAVYVPRPPIRINTSNHIHITYLGKTATYREWAETLGISRHTLYDRLHRYHWTVEDALTTPLIHDNKTRFQIGRKRVGDV